MYEYSYVFSSVNIRLIFGCWFFNSRNYKLTILSDWSFIKFY